MVSWVCIPWFLPLPWRGSLALLGTTPFMEMGSYTSKHIFHILGILTEIKKASANDRHWLTRLQQMNSILVISVRGQMYYDAPHFAGEETE